MGITHYHDTGEHAYKERDLEKYKEMVFRDSDDLWLVEPPVNLNSDPMVHSLRHYHVLEHYKYNKDGKYIKDGAIEYDWDLKGKKLFGGEENFFKKSSNILDLGSGYGQVTQEINKKIDGVNCIGLDTRYFNDRPKNTEGLVGGKFENLPFADNSFDRVLSIESFPAWLPNTEALIDKYFSEITRISENNTIWRGTLPMFDEDFGKDTISFEQLMQYFGKYGWEVFIDRASNSFAAKLNKETQ